MKLKLSIILVNYYSEELILKCINSIHKFTKNKKFIEIIIVDNGSKSTTLQNFEFCKIITNKNNRGFGAACNIGFKNSNPNSEFVLFLNPDTEVFENTLTEAIEFMSCNPNITVLGCQQIDKNNKVLKTCATHLNLRKYLVKSFYLDKILPRFFKSHHMTYWSHLNSSYVEHVMGSFYMLRSEDFKKMRGFDEHFFVYYEDLDLSKRIIDNGGKIFFNTDFKIYHETGGSSKNFKPERMFYSLDATLTYGKIHFSKINYVLLFVFISLIEPLLRIILSILKLNLMETKQVFLAYRLLYLKRIF